MTVPLLEIDDLAVSYKVGDHDQRVVHGVAHRCDRDGADNCRFVGRAFLAGFHRGFPSLPIGRNRFPDLRIGMPRFAKEGLYVRWWRHVLRAEDTAGDPLFCSTFEIDGNERDDFTSSWVEIAKFVHAHEWYAVG